jgi:hypothetical protein
MMVFPFSANTGFTATFEPTYCKIKGFLTGFIPQGINVTGADFIRRFYAEAF